MKYFEMEEKRVKSFLKMEELWGKERKEDRKVRRCPKSCHFNCVWCLFKGRSVVYYSETLRVMTVEAGGFAEGRSSSGVMSST